MKTLLLTLFLGSLMVSCNTDQSHLFKEGDIISKLKLDDSGRFLSASLINNTSIDTYLTDNFNIKIYKLDSNGKYINWTDVFVHNTFYLSDYMDTTLSIWDYTDTIYFDNAMIQISDSSYSKLKNEYLTRMDVQDSLEELSALDCFELNLWSLLFIKKERPYIKKIDLYPLLVAKGSFKIFCYYRPKKSFCCDYFYLELPNKINNHYIFDNKIKSDTIFISYE